MGRFAAFIAPLAALVAVSGCSGVVAYEDFLHVSDAELSRAECAEVKEGEAALEAEIASRASGNPLRMYWEMAHDLGLALAQPWRLGGPAAPTTAVLRGDLNRVRARKAEACGDG